MAGVLEGVRVLDMGRYIAGPLLRRPVGRPGRRGHPHRARRRWRGPHPVSDQR